ncbi:YdaU family protein [Acinetobacter baumannii]|nr:YdaU family protein [Acinetobacter baumannii]
MHYYKRNIGDYHKKAGRLSMLEHGAYTLLLDACYDRERFPTLEEALDWAWARTDEEEAAVKFVLKKFFTEIDGVYVQNHIQEELDAYKAKAETNARIAKEREEKRKKGKQGVNDLPPVVNESCNSGDEPPPNHKPLTINQEPIIDSSSNAREENSQFTPIQFAQYQIDDHKRYSMREFISEYSEFQYDFISLAQQRFVSVPEIDLRTMIQNFGDWYFANESSSLNTPSIWLVKWFSWVQNNEKQVAANRKKQEQISIAGQKSQEPGYFANLFEEQNESQIVDVTPAKKFPMIEGVGHA